MNTSDHLLTPPMASQRAGMHITIVTETFPPEVNGVAMTLGRIVDGLLQRGHTVQIIRPRQAREQAVQRERLEHVLVPGLPVPTYGELRLGLPCKGRMIELWNARRPDIVHVVTEGPLGHSAVAAARKLHLPMTSSFHTNFQSYAQHYGIGLLRSPIERYLRTLHNRTQATMVPTQAMVDDLQARGYDNVTLVSRGVEIGLFHPQRRSEVLRQRWRALPDDPVVILVGRLAKEKNVGLVLAAFRSIQARQPRAKLVLVGDGPLRKQLEEACPQAHFAGIQKGEDLAAHYASGDLFLFPSLTETFGNVIPEALASGLAVVAYANAAAQELITSERNGLLVANGDESGFVQIAVALALDVPKQLRLRAAAPHSVAHLAWHAVCESFEAVLRQALARQGESRQTAHGATLSLSPTPTQQGLSHSHLRSLL